MPRSYWLIKSEPDVFGFDDLLARPGQTEPWNGVRNYQARNYMRDGMRLGDRALFYHSNTQPPHVAGVAEVVREAYPDPTAWDPASDYFDPKASPDDPRWLMVDFKAVSRLPQPVPLAALKANPALEGMLVIRKGQRLSVQPVDEAHYREVLRMGGAPADL